MSVREKARKALSDKELPKFNAEPIKSVLGDSMPKLALTKAGRIRLIGALSYKYGENFRNFEKANDALTHFDDEYSHLKTYLHLKGHVRG